VLGRERLGRLMSSCRPSSASRTRHARLAPRAAASRGDEQLLNALVSIAAQPPTAVEPPGLDGQPAAVAVGLIRRRPEQRVT
jgi:hypothetical protein